MIARRTKTGSMAMTPDRTSAPAAWKRSLSATLCWCRDRWRSMRSRRAAGRESVNQRRHQTPALELVLECEQVSYEVVELVGSADIGEWTESEAQRLQARLTGLEHRVTEVADTSGVCESQLLDDVSGMLIALRGALEVADRLRDAITEQCVLEDAALDLVALRAQDLRAALSAYEDRCS